MNGKSKSAKWSSRYFGETSKRFVEKLGTDFVSSSK